MVGRREQQQQDPRPASSFSSTHLPPEETLQKIRSLTKPHVESFDFFLDEGLGLAVASIPRMEVDLVEQPQEGAGASAAQAEAEAGGTPRSICLKMWYEGASFGYPTKSKDDSISSTLTPRECRERGLSYSAPLQVDVCYQVDGGEVRRMQRRLGECPVMVLSRRCHLRGKKAKELVRMGEESLEVGGYFVVSGLERVIRLLQVPRRNVAQALQRSSFKKRGTMYSDRAVSMRCARPDQTTCTVHLHHLSTGGATLRFSLRKQEYLVPVVILLKALKEATDQQIYERLLAGDDSAALAAQVEVLLKDASTSGLRTQKDCLAKLGSLFRNNLSLGSHHSDVDAGRALIDRFILVHLRRYPDKQECLLHMTRKLLVFAQGGCAEDNADALCSHELLLPGHLFCAYVKEKMEETMQKARLHFLRDARADFTKCVSDLGGAKYLHKIFDRYGEEVGRKVATFLSTGNVMSSSGLDLMQASGFTIVAERINMLRYLSHFRSVHRGQFFTTMKTTAVRKLLPESWGFLCPVHTPDGSPCGLLNHMAAECSVIASDPVAPNEASGGLEQVLVSLGVTPAGVGVGDGNKLLPAKFLTVMVDGRVVGGAMESSMPGIVAALRRLKLREPPGVDPTLEVAWFPTLKGGTGPYPGLYVSTKAARMIRPVIHLESGKQEWVGPMEQTFMEIACLQDDIRAGVTTHREVDPTNMLSLIASLTPFSDYNQSPRNMYQCQMGKQTMGTAAHSLTPHKTDNKMYRLLSPQAPICRTRRHVNYQMDEFPQGTNAVVAVISYTGFDMEDAMILNKSSYERGFGHASILKTHKINLHTLPGQSGGGRGRVSKTSLRFSNRGLKAGSGASPICPSLDADGLPQIGAWIKPGDPLYCIVDEDTGKVTTGKHKDTEMACVETIRAVGPLGMNKEPLSEVSLTLRFPRNPIIGDKFSSRHGQKGVMSILWPQEDMPFSESGISPDIIINPHAFPSRMTIGMLIESMAGKSGALHGCYQDATPFTFHEKNRIIDYFGDELRSSGYAYYGSEPLYSGVTGTLMHADIFVGLVYYQRLRHMVSDKSQVRATGAVSQLTRQPIKGRKRGGGIRFGEMERDSLLSHGTAFLLHDRLMNCSDRHTAHVCGGCGNMLSTCVRPSTVGAAGQEADLSRSVASAVSQGMSELHCLTCDKAAAEGDSGTPPTSQVHAVAMPYVFRYLANELAGMNIKMTLSLGSN